jgi:hypothetical protein
MGENVVSNIKGETWTEDFLEQGAEQNIKEKQSDTILDKIKQ